MVVLTTNFLFHLFCGFVNCDPSHDPPSDPLNFSLGSGNDTLSDENFETHFSTDPIVITTSGALEGFRMKTIKRRNIFAFTGIEYGEDPGGKYRFKPPRPKVPWDGIRSAKNFGYDCVQFHGYRLRIQGRERCLFLNIYTPLLPSLQRNISNSEKLPVIFYIHGGSFLFGSGSEHGPAYMLDEDVILVTINYRMGVLGFLSTGDDESPGNNGLRDQELALKWVYENIESFGGDKTRITLMGQSAGAVSVSIHMLHLRTRKYFQNAVQISGSAFSHWGIKNPKRNYMLNKKLGLNTGCSLNTSKTFVKCLRKMDAFDLINRQQQLYDWIAFPPILFGPVIEHNHLEAIITEPPEVTYRKNAVYKVPLISTMVADEGQLAAIVMNSFGITPTLKKFWKARAPDFLDYRYVADAPDNISDKIAEFYMGKEHQTVDTRVYGDMTSDRYFFYATRKSLQAHCQIAPTYGYMFSLRGKYSHGSLFGADNRDRGAIHADDVNYYFNNRILFPGWKTTDREYSAVRLVNNLVTNFARTGKPLLTLETRLQYPENVWEPIVDPHNVKYLQIKNDLEMIPQPFTKRLDFWESLGLPDVSPFI